MIENYKNANYLKYFKKLVFWNILKSLLFVFLFLVLVSCMPIQEFKKFIAFFNCQKIITFNSIAP